jgi:hypothetical protein
MDEIAIPANGASHLLAPGRIAIEGLLDGLHREVGMAAVNDLKESDLRIACEVNVLRTIGN